MKVNLIQGREQFGSSERQQELREVWKKNDGLFDECTQVHGRPSFASLFMFCQPGMVNVIANDDIYFDAQSIEHLRNFPQEGKHCWSLSRWDVKPDGSTALWDHGDSQDVWVVFGGPHQIDAHTALARADDAPETLFEHPLRPGEAGCDNRIMRVLQEAGFIVSNPSKTVRCFHLHLSQYRSYVKVGQESGRGVSKMVRIQPPWAFCAPSEL